MSQLKLILLLIIATSQRLREQVERGGHALASPCGGMWLSVPSALVGGCEADDLCLVIARG